MVQSVVQYYHIERDSNNQSHNIGEIYNIHLYQSTNFLNATHNREHGTITRGNDRRLQKARVVYDLRKYYFTNRAVNIWNSLPNHVVLSDTVNIFKSRLDKFWQHQDRCYL